MAGPNLGPAPGAIGFYFLLVLPFFLQPFGDYAGLSPTCGSARRDGGDPEEAPAQYFILDYPASLFHFWAQPG